MTDTSHTSRPGLAADRATPHLVLVGLPGAGKTTVGEAVASRLGRPFLDLDREIERREGMPVSRIFAERGEHAFRGLERALTEELRGAGGMVLAPGGGWIADPGNVALLRPPARIIYLRVTPETAFRRMGPERVSRPLLQRPDPLDEVRRLEGERRALYEGSADVTVNTELLTVSQVVNKVCELV
jgi:shikimate kinase